MELNRFAKEFDQGIKPAVDALDSKLLEPFFGRLVSQEFSEKEKGAEPQAENLFITTENELLDSIRSLIVTYGNIEKAEELSDLIMNNINRYIDYHEWY